MVGITTGTVKSSSAAWPCLVCGGKDGKCSLRSNDSIFCRHQRAPLDTPNDPRGRAAKQIGRAGAAQAFLALRTSAGLRRGDRSTLRPLAQLLDGRLT
jgi:hypothetical protein